MREATITVRASHHRAGNPILAAIRTHLPYGVTADLWPDGDGKQEITFYLPGRRTICRDLDADAAWLSDQFRAREWGSVDIPETFEFEQEVPDETDLNGAVA